MARIGGRIYAQIYPNKTQAEDIDVTRSFTPEFPVEFLDLLNTVTSQNAITVDWDAVRRAGLDRSGLPTPIARTIAFD